VASQQWADDDDLMAALAEALQAERDVPREFIEAGQAAFTWYGIDAELAALTFDSETEAMAAAVRSDEATPRFLTFTAAGLTIGLEIGQDEAIGQIAPAQTGQVDAYPAQGPALTATIDEVGFFLIRPLPAFPFRLHCRSASGVSALTTWITW
jgi:hypothetical protein